MSFIRSYVEEVKASQLEKVRLSFRILFVILYAWFFISQAAYATFITSVQLYLYSFPMGRDAMQMIPSATIFPEVTVCPSYDEAQQKLATITKPQCYFVDNFSNGTTPWQETTLPVQAQTITVEWIDAVSIARPCYTAVPGESMQGNFNSLVYCTMKSDADVLVNVHGAEVPLSDEWWQSQATDAIYGTQYLVGATVITPGGELPNGLYVYQSRTMQAYIPRQVATDNLVFTVEFGDMPMRIVSPVNIDDGWFFLCLAGGIAFLLFFLFKLIIYCFSFCLHDGPKEQQKTATAGGPQGAEPGMGGEGYSTGGEGHISGEVSADPYDGGAAPVKGSGGYGTL